MDEFDWYDATTTSTTTSTSAVIVIIIVVDIMIPSIGTLLGYPLDTIKTNMQVLVIIDNDDEGVHIS